MFFFWILLRAWPVRAPPDLSVRKAVVLLVPLHIEILFRSQHQTAKLVILGSGAARTFFNVLLLA
jgi:hypothetical protein